MTVKCPQLLQCREELNRTIEELQGEVACITVNNPQVAQEYHRRQEEMQQLSDNLHELEDKLNIAQDELATLKVGVQLQIWSSTQNSPHPSTSVQAPVTTLLPHC